MAGRNIPQHTGSRSDVVQEWQTATFWPLVDLLRIQKGELATGWGKPIQCRHDNEVIDPDGRRIGSYVRIENVLAALQLLRRRQLLVYRALRLDKPQYPALSNYRDSHRYTLVAHLENLIAPDMFGAFLYRAVIEYPQVLPRKVVPRDLPVQKPLIAVQ